jgi:tetratricopeptide (TPR) repeat protein
MEIPMSQGHASLVAVAALTVSAALGSAWSSRVVADSAAVENKQVAAALLDAKKLAGKKQWSKALDAVHKAQAVPDKSAYAQYKLEEFEAYLLTQQREYGKAARVFEHLARSENAPRAQRPGYFKTAAQLYLQTKSYDAAAEAAVRATKLNGNDLSALELLAQSQYLAQDYRSAAGSLKRLVSKMQQSGKRPDEKWFQMMLTSYDRLHDDAQVAAAWESLLQNYPKADYWKPVLKRKAAHAPSDALEAGYHRLMFDIGVLEKPADYEELALSAIDAGAPSAAVTILEQGFENGSLRGPQEARYKRMLDFATKRSAESEQSTADLTARADSIPAAAKIELGRVHLGRGEYTKAIEELSRGIQASGIEHKDQARIDLGIAYLKSDQLEHARETFASVSAKSQWRDLAELWELRASSR